MLFRSLSPLVGAAAASGESSKDTSNNLPALKPASQSSDEEQVTRTNFDIRRTDPLPIVAVDIERLFQSKLRGNVRKELLDGGSANNSQHLRHVSVSMGNVSHGCPWLWMLTDEAWARLKTPKPIGMQGVGSGSVAG